MNRLAVLRGLALAVAVAAIGLTVEALRSGAAGGIDALWYWPRSLANAPGAWAATQLSMHLKGLLVAQLLVHIGGTVIAVVLAGRINRHRWDWAALVLLMPPFIGLLSFLGQGRADQDRWGGVVGRFLYFLASLAQSRRCGACGSKVPLYVRPGEKCPHCGSEWKRLTVTVDRYPGGL